MGMQRPTTKNIAIQQTRHGVIELELIKIGCRNCRPCFQWKGAVSEKLYYANELCNTHDEDISHGRALYAHIAYFMAGKRRICRLRSPAHMPAMKSRIDAIG
jgi:hypothetical protein